MTITLAAALAAVRGWTRLYTARLDAPIRYARRAEIESDLWELHEDARRRGASPTLIAVHMVVRLLGGVVDDLAWRVEQIGSLTPFLQQALWASAVASVAFVWWLTSMLQTVAPHTPPEGINVVRLLYPVHPVATVPPLPRPPIEFVQIVGRDHRRLPPPPPPPPPKARPPGR